MRNPRSHSQAGFTLFEVMMVVAIVGLLAALAGPNLTSVYRRAVFKGEARKLYAALLDVQGMATAEATPHCIYLDRTAPSWQIRENSNEDGNCNASDSLVKAHPPPANPTDWPNHVEFGPTNGSSAAFPSPYDGVAHDSWCSACGGDNGSLFFDVDGRIVDNAGEPISGSILMRNNTSPEGLAQGILFIGATGNVRLFEVAE